jgi:hypothetical protein
MFAPPISEVTTLATQVLICRGAQVYLFCCGGWGEPHRLLLVPA